MVASSNEDEWRRATEAMSALAPRVLPHPWAIVETYDNASIYRCSGGKSQAPVLRAILEVAVYDGAHDGELWAHLSLSAKAQLPSWSDLREAKDLFLGRDRLVVQVFPPEGEYVNDHPYVLHLWSRLEGPRLTPDFRRFSPELGRPTI